MDVPDKRRWEAMEVGREVTVLVDPRRPKRSVVYELSKYRVVDSNRGGDR
jgi:hypothetical protein